MSEDNQHRSENPQRRRNNQRNRSNNKRPQGGNRQSQGDSRPPRRRSNHRKPAPLKMTFWLKLKKFFGALDEEKERAKQHAQNRANQKSSPSSRESSSEASRSTPSTRSTPKSNTRVASSERTQKRAPLEKEVLNSRLYVGNLSYEATEYDLEDLFKGIGNVKKIDLIYNKATHRSKGYGFVEMHSLEDAKRAVEVLHEQPFMGRNMVVNGAKARQDSDASAERSA